MAAQSSKRVVTIRIVGGGGSGGGDGSDDEDGDKEQLLHGSLPLSAFSGRGQFPGA